MLMVNIEVPSQLLRPHLCHVMQCVKVADSSTEWEGGQNHTLKVCVAYGKLSWQMAPQVLHVLPQWPACLQTGPKAVRDFAPLKQLLSEAGAQIQDHLGPHPGSGFQDPLSAA